MLTRVLSATACAALLFALPGAAPCDAEHPRDAIYSCAYVPDAIDFAGSIFLYLRNSGDEPLTISEISLDGVPIGTIWRSDESFLAADVRERYIAIENDRVAWYRVYPNPIPPGGIAEVILRLNPPLPEQEPQPQSTLSVTFAGQEPVETTVAMEAPPFVLEYVGIEPDLRVLHLYARAKPGVTARLDRVEIDGRPVSAEVRPVYSGLHYARVTLPRAWREASYHAAAIGNGDGLSATLIRALPAPAPIGIMGNTGDEVLQEYRNKLFEASLAFTPAPLDTYERLARYDMVGSYIYGRKTQPEAEKFTEPVYYDQFDFGENRNLQQIKQQPALWAWFLEDEPDGRYHRTELPRGSISRDVERANQFCRVFDPGTPVYLQIDHGSYPRNLYTFGQIPDYLCTHAYALGTQNVVSASQEHVAHTRNATRPRPFYYLNTGYCVREGTRVFEPREIQLEVYAALAEGAKSLQWYPAHGERGLLNHSEMWDAVGAMNGILHQVLPLLAIGTPVAAPITDGGDVLASAILCGDRAMAVVLVNRDFAADAERFVLNPARTKVRVRLPRFMQAAGALKPRFPEATVTVDADISDSVVEFETDVEAGKVIVIYADDAVPEQMRRARAQCLRQYAVTPSAE